MTNSPTPEPANPDDECFICGETRENHGDKHHMFTMEDILVPIKPAGVATRKPPEERKATATPPEPERPDLHLAFATLVEILAEKDLLTKSDIIRVFKGLG